MSIYKSQLTVSRLATIWPKLRAMLRTLLHSEEAGPSLGNTSKPGIKAAQLTWAVGLVLWLAVSTIKALNVGEITYQAPGGTNWSVKTMQPSDTVENLPLPPPPPAP